MSCRDGEPCKEGRARRRALLALAAMLVVFTVLSVFSFLPSRLQATPDQFHFANFSGVIITLGLLSFNLAIVRVDGNPALPYLLAWIGYTGLLLVTLLFVWRFLASLEGRVAEARTTATEPPRVAATLA